LIAFVQDDDLIELDATKNTITLKVSDEEIAKRKAGWKQPELKASRGVLYKYAMCVKDASEGCVTDEAPSRPSPLGKAIRPQASLIEDAAFNQNG
jgi:dihydroxy-acid dehydratase